MNTDRALRIGSTHSLCQDYVIARNGSADAGGPYVILSDGCSSSSDTDIGARLLVKAVERFITAQDVFATLAIDDVEVLHRDAARLTLGWADVLGVPSQSVDATLMTIQVKGERLIVACSGDGIILLESQTGTVDLFVISSPSGYPYYPSYAWQPERLSELVSNDRTTKELKHFRRDSAAERFTLLEVTTSNSLTEVCDFNAREYRYAAVASDGINSFYLTRQSDNGKRVEDVNLLDVLDMFWKFKNFNGAFVERRLNRFTKDAYANGWQHADDLSLGVIYLGE